MEEWNFKFQKLKGAYGGGSAPGYDNRERERKESSKISEMIKIINLVLVVPALGFLCLQTQPVAYNKGKH